MTRVGGKKQHHCYTSHGLGQNQLKQRKKYCDEGQVGSWIALMSFKGSCKVEFLASSRGCSMGFFSRWFGVFLSTFVMRAEVGWLCSRCIKCGPRLEGNGPISLKGCWWKHHLCNVRQFYTRRQQMLCFLLHPNYLTQSSDSDSMQYKDVYGRRFL